MNNLKYNLILAISKIPIIGGGNRRIIRYLRKEGCKIGNNTHIFSNIASSEPYLVEIGNNCTISTEVIFLTHDASIGLFAGREAYSDICGCISIGNNVFIGNRSIILYGVSIPENTIIAAGSVVTKSVMESGCIIGGNPAKIIGRIEDFISKTRENFMSLHGLDLQARKIKIMANSKNLIKR